MTTDTKQLVKQFKKSGLKLIIRDEPFSVFGNESRIFQMDVLRSVKGTRRNEWFEMFLGEGDVNVQILDVDPVKLQVLLLVQEPERVFEVTERKTGWRAQSNADRRFDFNERGEVFREDKHNFYIQQTTSADKRHFLMGVDERQLFVAQLTRGVTNITEARRSLGNTVQFHEGNRKMTPNRQGEWFFIKATKQQEEDIELLLQKKRIFIVNKKNIGKYAGREGGNPHVADEIVVIPESRALVEQAKQTKLMRKRRPIVLNKYPIRRREVFVRGRIRHIDHKTIKYSHWYQVILNNENQIQATATWID